MQLSDGTVLAGWFEDGQLREHDETPCCGEGGLFSFSFDLEEEFDQCCVDDEVPAFAVACKHSLLDFKRCALGSSESRRKDKQVKDQDKDRTPNCCVEWMA
jgi:hypothetical protein